MGDVTLRNKNSAHVIDFFKKYFGVGFTKKNVIIFRDIEKKRFLSANLEGSCHPLKPFFGR